MFLFLEELLLDLWRNWSLFYKDIWGNYCIYLSGIHCWTLTTSTSSTARSEPCIPVGFWCIWVLQLMFLFFIWIWLKVENLRLVDEVGGDNQFVIKGCAWMIDTSFFFCCCLDSSFFHEFGENFYYLYCWPPELQYCVGNGVKSLAVTVNVRSLLALMGYGS